MENLGYLKDQLQMNIPRMVTMAKRGKSYPDKFNPGQVQYFYTFHLADGPDVKHYAKECEEESLKLFNPGETLQVVLNEGKNSETGQRYGYLVWTDKEGAEARSAARPQLGTNTHLDGQKKKLDERKAADDEKWAKKDIAQTLGMLTKLFFDATSPAQNSQLRFDEAIALAKLNRTKFTKAIEDCYMEDVIGPNETPKPAAPIAHVPSVSIDEVNAAFAPDRSEGF